MTDDLIAEWINGFEVEGDLGLAATEAARLERWPGDAPFEFDALAASGFPKVLARGAWLPEVAGDVGAGRDFAIVCEMIAARIGARVIVFEYSTHNPQLQEPDAFNQLLRDLWGRD